MIRSPLFAGEIIHLSRTPRTWAIRTGLAVFLAAAAAMAWPWSGSALKMHVAGTAMFQVFFWTEFVAGLLLVPAMVAPSIAWERENGTLDLLSVAPVTDLEIVSGKLFANGALVAATLGAGLPFGVAALMLGGATPEMLLATTVGLVLHGIFAASISILMSASSDRAGVATGLAIVTLVVFGVISLTLGGVGSKIAEGLLVGRHAGTAGSFREGIPPVVFSVLCPWSATVHDAVGGGVSGASWLERCVAWAIHLLESGGALALAGIVLRHKRSPGSRGAALVPLTGPGPRIPMAVLAPPVVTARPS
ncbi:MAG: ABC transporter permease, partial [Planctomycetes bacterium]|nr:ABC transporter permease [Planctomycetota bacterium]